MLLNNFLFTGLQFPPPTILMLQEPAVVLADHIVILLRLPVGRKRAIELCA